MSFVWVGFVFIWLAIQTLFAIKIQAGMIGCPWKVEANNLFFEQFFLHGVSSANDLDTKSAF